jgi:hypothetical protein
MEAEIGKFLSGKPGNLASQTKQLKRNAGFTGGRKTRKNK